LSWCLLSIHKVAAVFADALPLFRRRREGIRLLVSVQSLKMKSHSLLLLEKYSSEKCLFMWKREKEKFC
jgi:hypothetical protein